ncbi:hypothetical protein SAY86_015567 [Trapa natans]|uniref:Uncharacterized protein n=1 Tax=Trapa natans TaxID=22666 RepID=A0AAN7LI76_TRANT|nr:hypothetical protein SAY86_015567 [Trapa natans]
MWGATGISEKVISEEKTVSSRASKPLGHPHLGEGKGDRLAKPFQEDSSFSLFHFGGPIALSSISKSLEGGTISDIGSVIPAETAKLNCFRDACPAPAPVDCGLDAYQNFYVPYEGTQQLTPPVINRGPSPFPNPVRPPLIPVNGISSPENHQPPVQSMSRGVSDAVISEEKTVLSRPSKPLGHTQLERQNIISRFHGGAVDLWTIQRGKPEEISLSWVIKQGHQIKF